MTLSELLPFLGTAILAIVSLIGIYRQARRNEAEASDKISAAWERLMKPYEERLTRLEKENKKLWTYIELLKDELVLHDIPVPDMPDTGELKMKPRPKK